MEIQDETLDSGPYESDYEVESQPVLGLNHFIILSILSFGLYELWWFYKSWKFFQQKEQSDIMPAMRAIFSIFFLIPLMRKIQDFAHERNYPETYAPVFLFIGWIVVNLLARLPDPFWILAILNFIFLIPPYKAFHYARLESEEFPAYEQQTLNGRQTAIVVVGSIFWVLVLLSFAVIALG